MNSTRFWIVGGEYQDTGFDTLVEGTARMVGPFTNRDQAMTAWRGLAEQTRSNALARFTIAREDGRAGA